jgi:uncharacterized phosphosugar-binding protein
MSGDKYIKSLTSLVQQVGVSQDQVLGSVAAKCASSLEQGGMIHLFGSGHSVIPTMDAYPRYGSFVGLAAFGNFSGLSVLRITFTKCFGMNR